MKKQVKKVKELSPQVKEIFTGSQVMMMLEEMNDNIKIIAENQLSLREEFVSFRDEMNGFRNETYSFRDQMYCFRDEMYQFRNETNANFEFVAKRLLDIEEEIELIKTKLEANVDKKWVLEQIGKLEKEIAQLRLLVMAKVS